MANFQIPAPPSDKRPVDVYQWLGKIIEVMGNTKGVEWHTNNILTIKQLGDSIGNDMNFVSTVDKKIHTALQPVTLPTGTDLDTLEITNLYTSGTDANTESLVNKPLSTGFILQVYNVYASETIKRTIQLAYCRLTGVLYSRIKSDNTGWTPWIKVITSADITPSNIANKVVQRDASGNFSAGTITASLNGNAKTATTLQTARTINGTSFNGSANITTANWGTARNITIGNTKKSVNGSADVSWSLSEIGVAAASHTHTSSQITDATNANTANMIVKRDGNGNFSAGTITASLSGNATTATTLQTARTINGTSFNGSANITTANWGTARTITIGSTGKSVNGSANVSWSLNEIGAAEGYSVSATTAATAGWYRIAQTTSTDQDTVIGNFIIRAKVSGKHSTTNIISGISYGNNPVLQQLSHTQYTTTGISKVRLVYHTTHTGNKVYLEVYVPDATARTITVKLEDYYGWSLVSPSTTGSVPTDYKTVELTLSSNRIVSNITGSLSGNATTATTLQTARTINGTSFNGSANITTANWGTARTLTIGNTGKSVNGSANVSWSLSEIGAAPVSHTHTSSQISDATNANTANMIVKRDASGNFSAGTITAALSGNATTATTLQTARTINGTSFNGSANISTANWGTARTLTIGNTGKSVNGSANVSWSLSEIGAVPHVKYSAVTDFNNIKTTGIYSCGASSMTNAPTTNHGTLIVDFNVGTPYQIWIPDNSHIIYKRTYTTSSSTWSTWSSTLSNSISGNSATATKLATARTINGTTFDGSANITTANWGTARTITIGNSGKSVNGSGNVSWTLSEIGAAAATHTHTSSQISDATNANTANMIVKRDASGNFSAGTITASLSGNATTATTLQTARTINGTTFNGSANITTANWGTARTITIGKTGKSVNGSANVSWSLSEIGAPKSAGDRSFGGDETAITTTQFIELLTASGAFDDFVWISRGSWSYANNRYINDTGLGNIHLAGCVVEVIGYSSAYTIRIHTPTTSSKGTTYGDFIYVNNGSSYSPGWRRLYNTSYKPKSADITDATSSNVANMIVKRDGSGNISVGTVIGALSGNASTATTLQTARTINGTSFNGSANITTANWGTARTLTIGNTGKSVNGSANVSWSLSEIGAAAASHTHSNYVPTTDYTLTTISKTLTLTTSWQDTGITGTNLATGSYMVQISGMSSDATSMWGEIFTGTMSWTSETTNSTDYDEIILHKAGHASNGRMIYLRTIRSASSGYLKLQIAASTSFTSSNYTFKFRKLI